MIAFNRNTKAIGNHHFTAFYSRRDGKSYRLSNDEIMQKYGHCMVMYGRIPEALAACMSNQMFVCNFDTQEELDAYYADMAATW
jgi:uncharacterized protein (DUF1330 family)